MLSHLRLSAATLAVGTEVTDGQILDRNSAWLSQKLVDAGLRVVEHRAVADEAADIARALTELSGRVDLLFVTGGLGPTSDDFTRNIISSTFGRPLEFDEHSWEHIKTQLAARGLVARDIQKQQCYFPKGARVLKNTAGTANAFSFTTDKGVRLFALPGPPREIEAVWSMHLASEIEELTPNSHRERLRIIRLLGLGESSVAEIVEPILHEDGSVAQREPVLRVGYRAHAPYVEVKLWHRNSEDSIAAPILGRIEEALSKWVINHDKEDVADRLIDFALINSVHVRDFATAGVFAERLLQRLHERGVQEGVCRLNIETVMTNDFAKAAGSSKAEVGPAPVGVTTAEGLRATAALVIEVFAAQDADLWRLRLKSTNSAEKRVETELEERPPFNYKVSSERGRRFVTERAFMAAAAFVDLVEKK